MAHILLAEDDESLRKFLAAALVKAGHAVTDFGDGARRLGMPPGLHLRPAADRYRDAGHGRDRAGQAGGRTQCRPQDHVHHRLCRRGAASGLAARPSRPRSCPSPSICARSWRKWTACWRRRKPLPTHNILTSPQARFRAPPCLQNSSKQAGFYKRNISRAGIFAGVQRRNYGASFSHSFRPAFIAFPRAAGRSCHRSAAGGLLAFHPRSGEQHRQIRSALD